MNDHTNPLSSPHQKKNKKTKTACGKINAWLELGNEYNIKIYIGLHKKENIGESYALNHPQGCQQAMKKY